MCVTSRTEHLISGMRYSRLFIYNPHSHCVQEGNTSTFWVPKRMKGTSHSAAMDTEFLNYLYFELPRFGVLFVNIAQVNPFWLIRWLSWVVVLCLRCIRGCNSFKALIKIPWGWDSGLSRTLKLGLILFLFSVLPYSLAQLK